MVDFIIEEFEMLYKTNKLCLGKKVNAQVYFLPSGRKFFILKRNEKTSFCLSVNNLSLFFLENYDVAVYCEKVRS